MKIDDAARTIRNLKESLTQDSTLIADMRAWNASLFKSNKDCEAEKAKMKEKIRRWRPWQLFGKVTAAVVTVAVVVGGVLVVKETVQ